ncbi:hypothetical protein A3B60_01020 [Candidatus Peregrinibacteria bacterium RIFCSPLOWO2_01_FULL_39_12]|nr:MAG: hypothetical protein A3I58_02840 [Candidatus Peregrinibacteria bacterium RIFCSPLOWO2_02_FULL_39_10]OGJ43048.1 MAG: hypothetical protein A3B60_01020 [Candidatus Peregrinibacteria bacterium RIFCSPLOWO2_01_FULL_39_12]
MTSIDIIENKRSAIEKYLKILKTYKKYSQKIIKQNVTLKGAVERYLYLVIQSAIDLAEAVISFKNLRKPTEYRETFEILFEEHLIPNSLKEKLIKMTGFRNVVAHDYTKLDFAVVYNVLKNRLVDIQQFSVAIKKQFKL